MATRAEEVSATAEVSGWACTPPVAKIKINKQIASCFIVKQDIKKHNGNHMDCLNFSYEYLFTGDRYFAVAIITLIEYKITIFFMIDGYLPGENILARIE